MPQTPTTRSDTSPLTMPDCACVHSDAHMCFDIRYNRHLDYHSDFDERCECYCHATWDEDEEE